MSNIYSHIHQNKPPEKLEEHKKLVEKYFQRILSFKNIDIEKIIDVFGIKDKQFVKKLVYETVLLHDEGKQNPAFQYLKMKNSEFKNTYEKMDVKNSKHSFLGAVLFFKTFIKDVANEKREKEFEKKLFLLVALSFLIAKHHSKLDNFSGFIERLKDELTKEGSEFSEFELNYEYFDIESFIAIKLIFSLLISADYYATLEYMTDLKIDDFGKIDIKKAQEEFESFKIIKNIRNGNYSKPIDELRSEMFLEAERNLDVSKNIFYLSSLTPNYQTI
jgi:CRISPR-associated endonuclease/helicase Cas3